MLAIAPKKKKITN